MGKGPDRLFGTRTSVLSRTPSRMGTRFLLLVKNCAGLRVSGAAGVCAAASVDPTRSPSNARTDNLWTGRMIEVMEIWVKKRWENQSHEPAGVERTGVPIRVEVILAGAVARNNEPRA